MNTPLVNDPKNFLEEVKPLVILYCENFNRKDPITNKPLLDERKIKKFKRKVIENWLTEEQYREFMKEFGNTKVSMRIRHLLKSIEVQPNRDGNMYHKKKLILQKIIEILETHIRKG